MKISCYFDKLVVLESSRSPRESLNFTQTCLYVLCSYIITGLDPARVVERVHAATKGDDDYVVVYVGR